METISVRRADGGQRGAFICASEHESESGGGLARHDSSGSRSRLGMGGMAAVPIGAGDEGEVQARPSTTSTVSTASLDRLDRQSESEHESEDAQGAQHDNDMLREEVKRLQVALVDKFRGRNKSIGGSQFRAPPKVAVTKCGECTNLRNTVKSVRGESRELRAFSNDLQSQMTAERAARVVAEQNLAEKEKEHLAHTSKLDSEIEKLKKQLEIATGNAGNMRGLMAELAESQSACQAANADKDTLGERFKLVEMDLATSRATCASDKERWNTDQRRWVHEVNELRRRLDATRSDYNELEERASSERKASEAQLMKCHAKVEELEAGLSDATERCSTLSEQNSHLSERCALLGASVQRERERADAACADAKRLQSEVNELTAQLKELQSRNALLEKQLKNSQNKQSKADNNLQSEFQKLQQALKSKEIECKQLDAELTKLRDEFAKLDAMKREETVALNGEMTELKASLASAVSDRKDLAKALEDLQTKHDELEDKMKQQLKMHKQALESALNSVVRLCVVAPTVNVHMGDQTLPYKAPLPQEKIRDFVELQVLPKFAKIFLQPQEGLAPNGDALDRWLQNLLVEMQGTIERHLTKLFSGQAAD